MGVITIDQLIRTRRRTMSLIINPDATITVRAPNRMPMGDIENFLERKKEWITRKIDAVRMNPVPAPKQFVNGEKFRYLGEEYPLELVDSRMPFQFCNGFKLATSHQSRAKDIFLKWYKYHALSVMAQRADVYAQQMDLNYRMIKVNNARSRWGSCAFNGNLNFSWRLVMAPLFVVDYVVVHELAHIPIKNHSRTFWEKVHSVLPQYREAVAWLNRHGQQLVL